MSLPASRRLRTAALFLLAASFASLSADAHDVWIGLPTEVGSSDLWSIRLFQGHGGDSQALARNDRRIERWIAVSPEGEIVDVRGLHGQDPAGFLRPSESGRWTIRYESRPLLHETDAETFQRHLEIEGLDAVIEARRTAGQETSPGRELYFRTLKALFVVEGQAITDSPNGSATELVLADLDATGLSVRLVHDGAPVAGALVDFHPQRPTSNDAAESRRTDSRGGVTFDLPTNAGGPWVVTAVIAEPADESAVDHDWQTHFVALTVAAP